MPVIQKLIDLDSLFNATPFKIIVNDLDMTDDIDKLNKLLYTKNTDNIDIVPRCECGDTRGSWLEGVVCRKCGTMVTDPFKDYNPKLWIRKFNDNTPFFNPMMWSIINRLITNKIDALRWLGDSSYNPNNVPPILHTIKALIGGRDYINLINNIDKILDYLTTVSQYKVGKRRERLRETIELYESNKDKLLCDYLPIVNKRLIIMEENNKNIYVSRLLANAHDITSLVLDTVRYNSETKRVRNRTAAIISKSREAFIELVKSTIAGKKGLARKNIYSSRSHFTMRCVITALDVSADYDEVHVPWLILPTVFRPHVFAKLLRRGYTPKEASKKIFQAVQKYDEEIAEIGRELIAEAPFKGIPVLANRNPSLLHGSIQRVFITKFKDDINDKTISISVLIAKAFNADFDGDEMNFTILLDNKMARLAEVLDPHYNVPLLDVYKVSGNINLPKTSSVLLANYTSKEEPEDVNCPIANKLMNM